MQRRSFYIALEGEQLFPEFMVRKFTVKNTSKDSVSWEGGGGGRRGRGRGRVRGEREGELGRQGRSRIERGRS